MSDLVKLTVVADGITYKVPGQKEPSVGQTYVTQLARRGQDIEMDKADADRALALGHVCKAGTKEADLAKSGPLTGPPANAVQISGEDGNLPMDKLKSEARRLGLLVDEPEDDGGTAVSGEAPEGLDLSDSKAVGALNVAQLKKLADTHGVTIESGDTKPKIVKKLVAHGEASKG